MAVKRQINIGEEIAKVHPLILREVAVKQMSVFSKDKITLTQVVVLDLLKEKGSCRMGDIAAALNLTMSAVTGIIDKMIEMGLVKRERSGKDRRIVWVSLFPKGKRTVKKVNRERINAVNDLFLVLTLDEKHEYLRLLEKIYKNLKTREK